MLLSECLIEILVDADLSSLLYDEFNSILRELVSVNYVKEINGLYVEMETNPLSGSAIALWYAMMQVNNRVRWIEQFTVAAQVLCLKSGLPETTFKRARLELRDKGFIGYTPRGSQAPAY